MFKQIRLESRVQFFTLLTCKESHLTTGGRSKNHFPGNIGQRLKCKCLNLQIDQKCLNFLFGKFITVHFGFDTAKFIEDDKSEIKSIVDSISLLCVRDNRDVSSLFLSMDDIQ